MTWTDDQWDAFAALLQAGWPGDFNEAERKAARVLLDDVEPAQVIVALKRLLHSGRKFYPRPAVSDLLAELRSEPERPTFDEAYPTIYRSAAKGLIPTGLHPLIAAFIEHQGLERLGQLPLDDPDWGEKHRRDLRAAWIEHVESWNGRQVAAIASGATGPRRLDPASALGLERGES